MLLFWGLQVRCTGEVGVVPATSKVTETRVKAVCLRVCAPNQDITVPQAICIMCVSNSNNKQCVFHTFQHPIAHLCVCVCVVHSLTISKMHAMHFNCTVVIVKGEWVTAVATVATLVCVCVCVCVCVAHTCVCVCVCVCSTE